MAPSCTEFPCRFAAAEHSCCREMQSHVDELASCFGADIEDLDALFDHTAVALRSGGPDTVHSICTAIHKLCRLHHVKPQLARSGCLATLLRLMQRSEIESVFEAAGQVVGACGSAVPVVLQALAYNFPGDVSVKLAPVFAPFDDSRPDRSDVMFPAAVFLSWWIVEHASLVKGRRVAELGAGRALPGLVAAFVGAHVTLTDASVEAVSAMTASIESNASLEGRARAARYDWASEEAPCQVDVVIGSDLVFDLLYPGSSQLVARATVALLDRHETPESETSAEDVDVIMCLPDRDGIDSFFAIMNRDFVVEAHDPPDEALKAVGCNPHNARIYVMRRRRRSPL